MKLLRIFFMFVLAIFLSGQQTFSQEVKALRLFSFTKRDAIKEWEEKVINGRVEYRIKRQGKEGFLLAVANDAASGIYYRMRFDAKRYPLISWKWNVKQFPKKKIPEEIKQDDYAARLFIIFPAFFFTQSKCLEYIWDEHLPKGEIFISPYSQNIKLIVAESGRENMGKWTVVERDIYKDYQEAFGEEPKLKVGAIAIMTDSEHTHTTAEALYDEIKVGYYR